MRQVNLVNDQDQIIGQTDLLDAHRGKGKKHQAVSLFLFHKKAAGNFELLLQQRSMKKIVGALQWANTICANLIPGEDHQSCLQRRVFEELGIKWQKEYFLEEGIVLDYQVNCEAGFAENEIDHIFISVLNNQEFNALRIELNPAEVFAYDWADWLACKNIKIDDKVITPWFDLFLNNNAVINKIDTILLEH